MKKALSSKGERTKQFVIEQAANVFNKNGYHGTSVQHLRAATRLTSGVIYSNFDGKQELAEKAFEWNVERLNASYKSAFQSKSSAREKLTAFIEHPYKMVHRSFGGGCPILNMSTEADDHLPWMRKKVIAAIDTMTKMVGEILQDGIANGEFRPIDVKQTGLFIFAAIEGSIMLAKAHEQLQMLKTVELQLKQYAEAVIFKS